MTHGTVPLITTGQMKDLGSALTQAVPTSTSFDRAKVLIGDKKLVQVAVQSLCRPKVKTPEDFKISKTIVLGTYKDVPALLAAFENSPCEWEKWLEKTIGAMAPRKIFLDLCVVCPLDLGFDQYARQIKFRAIVEKAAKYRLGLCPPETGPQLRLQYLDQPTHETLHVAMEPFHLKGSETINHYPYDGIYVIERKQRTEGMRYKDLVLSAWRADGIEDGFEPEDLFVFAKQK